MKKIFSASILAFSLNFAWEISQSFLYAPHYNGVVELLEVHFLASLGDVAMVWAILSLTELLVEKFAKKRNKNWQKIWLILSLGFLLSVSVEKYALSNGLWAYNFWMPVVPWLKVGLTPVLQMILIPMIVWHNMLGTWLTHTKS